MQPTIRLIRAVSSEFARRTIKPLLVAAAIILVLLHLLGVWQTTRHAWWWLFEAAIITVTVVYGLFVVATVIVMRSLRPKLSAVQDAAVVRFVDSMQRIADGLSTPQPVILFYILRDSFFPRPNNFIETMAKDSRTLGPELLRLRRQL